MASRENDSLGQQNDKESDVSKEKTVQIALEEARNSSRERGQRHPPRTPTGLVVSTGRRENGSHTPRALDMNSPSTSDVGVMYMDQLLATTYDSRDYVESNAGGTSINTSDEIIRKVEMEIATARMAATEAQSRLADALETNWDLQYKHSDLLDDLDIHDLLSLSSGEANSPDTSSRLANDGNEGAGMELLVDTRPEEKTVQDGSEVIQNIESAVSQSDEGGTNESGNEVPEMKLIVDTRPKEKTVQVGSEAMKNIESALNSDDDETDPTDSPTGSSSHGSACLRLTGTQQTFESGVELPLEDVEATLAVVDTDVTHSSDEEDHGACSPRSEPLADEFSDYTEETVTDDDNDDDVSSEYTEETLHSDDEVEEESERDSDDTGSVNEETNGDAEAPVVPNAAERPPSPKPWIVGSRDMHKSPKEAKPWWSGGWWPDDEKAKKCNQIGDMPAEKGKESNDGNELSIGNPNGQVLTFPTCVGGTGYVPTMSSYETESRATGPMSPWSTAPDTEDGKSTTVENDEVTKVEDAIHKYVEKVDASVLRDLVVSNVNMSPQDDSEAAKREEGCIKVHFRQPYPVPPQVAKPRLAQDIIADHTTGVPQRVTRWSKPKPELHDLIAAVKDDSLHRRSNAIGALKIMLSRDVKNQVILVRTTGFLEALVFACSKDIQSSPEMEAALIARNRGVTTIMKVCGLKENRILVMTEPGLPECLVKVVKEDTGEARAHACASLAMLSKTPKNRELMAGVDDLINSLALVVKGTIDPQISPVHVFNEDQNSGIGVSSLDDDATESSESTFGQQSSAVVNLYSSDSIRKQKVDKRTEYELQAKINACAVLMHLAKHCSVSSKLAANHIFMDSMMTVSCDFDSRLNTKCIEILSNITRFNANNSEMANNGTLVETLLKCGKSKVEEDRVWALRSFQNMAADSSSKVILANSKILTLLSICAMRKSDEQEAAVAAIYNLSTEPGAVVPITNTRNVVATLVHLAHNPKVSAQVQRMSCEALVTVGLWLQTLAGTGTVPDEVSQSSLLPTHKTVGWQRWD